MTSATVSELRAANVETFAHKSESELVQFATGLSQLRTENAKLRAALMEVATRGPVDNYLSKPALLVRLVGTQTIARAALQESQS